ncbi:uncharacterized protein LOC113349165 [Papaver somniferum]|uniref:uncharacterized protein LOC113349165 n=1 Tax=Papaver somniferum TaxID=3469 RepID=UPI000E705BBC|nr:uncharacterized protein LOC113349165 [Papaver somniferum]
MATENKSSNSLKLKSSSNQVISPKGKSVLPLKNPTKKIEIPSPNNSKKIADLKQKSALALSKLAELKGKQITTTTTTKTKTTTTTTSSKSIVKSSGVRKRSAKKVFTLAGQKYDPPEEREPLRIFYESLSKQIPSSEMAEFWMMEHGLLSPERAKKAYARKQKRQQQIRNGIPIKPQKPALIKAPKPADRPESSQKQQTQPSKNGDVKMKKRTADDDDDFLFKLKKSKG